MNKKIIDELCSLSESERNNIISEQIKKGVAIPFPQNVFIGKDVKLESGCVILSGCILTGKTIVESGCLIGPDTSLHNTSVGKDTELDNVQSEDSEIGEGGRIGPFVHIRPNSKIAPFVHLGNFVEVKNSTIGSKTSVSHLTYVGDSDVGEGVNFGCGCVTVNFTGKEKFRTTIGNHAFIGCNTNLVAPVTVGDYGYTAAGSTITDDVPENSLGIARAKQVNKVNWVLKKKPYRGME